MLEALLNSDIKTFIRDHENADVRALALKKPPNAAWPYAAILDQIKARQKAKLKIPAWLENGLEHDDIIFPPSNILEQASSQSTARYKASLAEGKAFVDLTGGAGVDSWALLESFENGTIIDANETAAQRIRHNLKNKNAEVFHGTAENCIQTMKPVDLALIDPQRRNDARKGLYRLEDCSPNIIELLPSLKDKAKTILLKTSPMLDIDQGIAQLGCVSAVHILEWQGECKEVLYVLTPQSATTDIPITAVKLSDNGKAVKSLTFTRTEEQNAKTTLSQPQKYLYEPSPAFMKAGSHKTLCARYNVSKLAPHTHLYTSENLNADFPGRHFEIIDIYPAQAKTLPLKKANLAIRNFPSDTATLKKKLKLKDGGDDYIFACTLYTALAEKKSKEKHVLIHCKKICKI